MSLISPARTDYISEEKHIKRFINIPLPVQNKTDLQGWNYTSTHTIDDGRRRYWRNLREIKPISSEQNYNYNLVFGSRSK